MITAWLKIRNRRSKEFVLKHLQYWLAVFSDTSKYKIYIYNENFDLPTYYYEAYTVVNKSQLLSHMECRKLYDKIICSKISEKWKPAAFALSAPYYYSNDKYIWNIDADDIIMHGPTEDYLDMAMKAIEDFDLPVISYDYIFSYNIYDIWRAKVFMPNHWTFGITAANSEKFKNEILNQVIANSANYINLMPAFNPHELNLDVLVSTHLKIHRQYDRYAAFITNDGFVHRGYEDDVYYLSKLDNNRFSWKFSDHKDICNLHTKTITFK
jgi:hypothetical protein